MSSPRPMQCVSASAKLQKLRISASTAADSGYSREYGMPSTHTFLVLAFYLTLPELLRQQGRISAPLAHGLQVAAVPWAAWIGLGRIYSLMHSVIDVGAGLALGFIFALVFSASAPAVLGWLRTGGFVPAQAALLAVALLRVWPVPAQATPSLNDAIAFVGAAVGIASGARYSETVVAAQPPLDVHNVQHWAISGAQTLLGFALILAAKAAVSAATRPVLRQVLWAVHGWSWLRPLSWLLHLPLLVHDGVGDIAPVQAASSQRLLCDMTLKMLLRRCCQYGLEASTVPDYLHFKTLATTWTTSCGERVLL